MERSYKDYVKIGLFIVLLSVLGIGGYLWISSQKRVKGTNYYYVRMPRATLVSTGTKVLMLGIPVGNVEHVDFHDDGVLLKIVLRDVKLREGSVAQVITPSALGTRMIDISPGKGEYLKDGDTILGKDSPTFDEMLFLAKDMELKVNQLIFKVDTILTNANKLLVLGNMQVENLSRTIEHTLANVNALIDTLESISSLQSSNLSETFEEIKVSIERLNNLLSRIDMHVDSISLLSKELILEVRNEIDSLKYRGSLGKLLEDEELYKELLRTAKGLRELVEDLKRNPSKYINVKIF